MDDSVNILCLKGSISNKNIT